MKRMIKAQRRKFPGVHYRVYEVDPDSGDEVEGVESFSSLEDAVQFAEGCDFPTHIVFTPDMDPDDDPDYEDYLEYAYDFYPYEVVWASPSLDV